jgi:hypothetical protein
MSAEVVNLRDRRPAEAREGGFEFICGICDGKVFAAVRLDNFPSCMSCRMWCEFSRPREGA